jgi:hypothetical protein
MKGLLIGYGEIGKGVSAILTEHHELIIYDKKYENINDPCSVTGAVDIDVLLIAFPYDEHFLSEVLFWKGVARPKATIVFSTVPIGTCTALLACHFPIEAKHPHIERDIRLNNNSWFGGTNEIAIKFMKNAGFKFRIIDDPRHTEFLKLRSTSIYGVNLEFARYSENVARQIGLDYSLITQYDKDYNELVVTRGNPEHQRYVLTAPEGMIGGHCVVPNAKILDSQFPSDFLKMIYNGGEDK